MTSVQKFGLSQETIDKINSVFSREKKIDHVIVYGSRALGRHRPGSDIDLVMTGAGLVVADLLRLKTELEELPIPYQVDLSIYHLIESDSLKEHIDRVGQVFWKRNP